MFCIVMYVNKTFFTNTIQEFHFFFLCKIFGQVMQKHVLMSYCEQQRHRYPAHLRRLISTFVVHCLDSMNVYLLYLKFEDSS